MDAEYELSEAELLLEEKSNEKWKFGGIRSFLLDTGVEDIHFGLYSTSLKTKLISVAMTLPLEKLRSLISHFENQMNAENEDELTLVLVSIANSVKDAKKSDSVGRLKRLDSRFFSMMDNLDDERIAWDIFPREAQYMQESNRILKEKRLKGTNEHFKARKGAMDEISRIISWQPKRKGFKSSFGGTRTQYQGSVTKSGVIAPKQRRLTTTTASRPNMTDVESILRRKRKLAEQAKNEAPKTKVIKFDEAIELEKKNDEIRMVTKMRMANFREQKRKLKEQELERLRNEKKHRKEEEWRKKQEQQEQRRMMKEEKKRIKLEKLIKEAPVSNAVAMQNTTPGAKEGQLPQQWSPFHGTMEQRHDVMQYALQHAMAGESANLSSFPSVKTTSLHSLVSMMPMRTAGYGYGSGVPMGSFSTVDKPPTSNATQTTANAPSLAAGTAVTPVASVAPTIFPISGDSGVNQPGASESPIDGNVEAVGDTSMARNTTEANEE